MGIRSTAMEFHNVYFSHVKHNANIPAHLLAKYAKGIVHQCMWMGNCPSFLELAILHDINSTVIGFNIKCVLSYQKKIFASSN